MADPQTYRPATGTIPEAPGVYRFSDENGRVIYVGKAKSLRSRLNSYFADLAGLHPRTRRMVTTAAAVQWTVVHTEVEALQLEYNWIKEYDPRFNVRYRDDKTYPVLAVTLNEEYPQLRVYRGPRKKGVRYFGPYAHAWAIRETLKLLTRVFPARVCSSGVFKRHGQIGRPCMLGYIDKCSAPCVGRVSAEEHRQIVLDFCDFLAGHTDQLIARIEKEMQVAAADMDFERAARLRDDAGALQAGRREAGRGARRRHRRRRRRLRRRRARGRGPGLPRARRPGPRPARLGRRDRGRQRRPRAGRRSSSRSSTASRPTLAGSADDAVQPVPREVLVPGAARGPPPADAVALRPARLAGLAARRPARRQAHARRDRRAQRPRGADPAQAPPRRRPHRPQRRARGAPGAAGPRHRAAAHRVHRRQPRPGLRRRGEPRRLRGRAGQEVGLPALRDPRRRGGRRRRGDRRGRPPPVRALPPRDRRGGRRPRRRRRARGETIDGVRRRSGVPGPGDRADGARRAAARHRPDDGAAAEVRLPAEPARRRRRRPAGRRGGRGALGELGITDVAVVGLAKRLEEVWLPGEEDPAILPAPERGRSTCSSGCATRPTASPSPTTARSARRG